MSYSPQYGLLNQCQPCGGNSISQASKMDGASRVQYATAKIVNPQQEITPHSTRISQIVNHLNALNIGNSQMQKTKSFLTGYTAGVAKY